MDLRLCRQPLEVKSTWALEIHRLVVEPVTHPKEKCFCQKVLEVCTGRIFQELSQYRVVIIKFQCQV